MRCPAENILLGFLFLNLKMGSENLHCSVLSYTVVNFVLTSCYSLHRKLEKPKCCFKT